MAAMSLAAPKQKYRDDVLTAVSALLDGRPEATPRKMFGHPGFAVGGKMFACLYADGVAVKLPEATAQVAITRPGIEAFRPYGKSMRRVRMTSGRVWLRSGPRLETHDETVRS
jgi:TfoX/Sxy family transcriptional regulator of competence genes